jgi:hypothetical protein
MVIVEKLIENCGGSNVLILNCIEGGAEENLLEPLSGELDLKCDP